MKDFLSVQKFKEIKTLFILEFILALLISLLVHINSFDINYFDWKALSLTIFIWLLSSKLDKERYFNLASLIGTGSIMYLCFWLMFNVKI